MRLHTILLVLTTTSLLAQTPTQRPAPKMDAVKAAIGLSDSQVTQLLQLRRDQREALRPTFQEMREKRKALRDSLEAGGADPTALGNLLVGIQELQKKAKATNDSFRAQALALLDDAQKAKLQALQQTVEEAAKLRPAVGQATALNLLQAPERKQKRALEGRRMMLRNQLRPGLQDLRQRRALR